MSNRQLINITFETEGKFKAIARILEPDTHPGEFAVQQVREYLKKATGKTMDELKHETYAGKHKMIGVEIVDFEELGYHIVFQTEKEKNDEFTAVSKRYNELQKESNLKYIEGIFQEDHIQAALQAVLAQGGELPVGIKFGFNDEYNDEGYDRRCDEVTLYGSNGDRWDDKGLLVDNDHYGEETDIEDYIKADIDYEWGADSIEQFVGGYHVVPIKVQLKQGV